MARALAVLLLAVASVGDPFLSEWVHVPAPRPQSRSVDCGNHSEDWYVEATPGGGVRAVTASARTPRVNQQLPFPISPADDRRGLSDVARFDSGWLVGFDAGEFGGGLWFFDAAESPGRRVHAPFDGPANARDPYKAENVKGFARVGNDLVVLMGLDHMGGRSGRVFRIQGDSTNIVLTPWTTLDGCPYAWAAIDDTSLLILTGSSLYELTTPGNSRSLHRFGSHVRDLYPSSLVVTSDRRIYVGARRYVLRLVPSDGDTFEETWWVPRACLHFRLTDKCECVVGR